MARRKVKKYRSDVESIFIFIISPEHLLRGERRLVSPLGELHRPFCILGIVFVEGVTRAPRGIVKIFPQRERK